MSAPTALPVLSGAVEAYGSCEWTAEQIKSELEAVGARHDLKLGKAQAPVRVAVTGRTVGPPLFESLEVLGRSETIRRITDAIERVDTG
jgi:glutamyl-tRNA synthetase